jgi:hypothetical protein
MTATASLAIGTYQVRMASCLSSTNKFETQGWIMTR